MTPIIDVILRCKSVYKKEKKISKIVRALACLVNSNNCDFGQFAEQSDILDNIWNIILHNDFHFSNGIKLEAAQLLDYIYEDIYVNIESSYHKEDFLGVCEACYNLLASGCFIEIRNYAFSYLGSFLSVGAVASYEISRLNGLKEQIYAYLNHLDFRVIIIFKNLSK